MKNYEALYPTEDESIVLLTYAGPNNPVQFGLSFRGNTLDRTPGNEWAYDAIVAAREKGKRRDEAITVE